ncbi:short-chain dehydrogenase [Xylariomycetidae sp. FL2044]|nr:short-chain dehydrogenase [Xylariomycetidae sp. FL2044]
MPDSNNRPLILITGANQGLGYETSKILAQSGKYHVIMACRSIAKGEAAIAQLKSEGIDAAALTPIKIDVADDATIEAAKESVKASFGHLDILINCAGVNGLIPVKKPGLRENYEYVFAINVFGLAVMTQTFLPLLRSSPYRDRRIVNVTTGLGQIGVALAEDNVYKAANLPAPEYRGSKAPVNMISAVDARLLQPEGIHVVLVAPGHTATAFNANNGPKTPAQGAANIVKAAVEGNAPDLVGKLQAEESTEYGW